jgi:hypothetical protein
MVLQPVSLSANTRNGGIPSVPCCHSAALAPAIAASPAKNRPRQMLEAMERSMGIIRGQALAVLDPKKQTLKLPRFLQIPEGQGATTVTGCCAE